jgi:hypothetical protein
MLPAVPTNSIGVPNSLDISRNRGTPIQLQNACAAMGANKDPDLSRSQVAYQPNRVVYMYWNRTCGYNKRLAVRITAPVHSAKQVLCHRHRARMSCHESWEGCTTQGSGCAAVVPGELCRVVRHRCAQALSQTVRCDTPHKTPQETANADAQLLEVTYVQPSAQVPYHDECSPQRETLVGDQVM